MFTLSNAQMGEIVYELLNAPGPEQVRRLLRAHPWLISSAEVDGKLTQVIANKYRARDLPSVAVFTACRGLLCRCRSVGVDAALAAQPSWPLSTQGPLTQLLALTEKGARPDLIIQQARAALEDIDSEVEADLYGLICYHLGLGYQDQAERGSNQALAPAMENFEAAVQAWQQQASWFGKGLIGRAQHNLGRLYWKRRYGHRSQDVETAMDWLKQALKAADEESDERRDALIMMGDAYLDRIVGERLDNIERGIECYQEAHRLAARENNVRHLGEIEHNLAVAYRVRLLDPRAYNYEQARKWAEQALERFNREESPEDWARTRAELATIYAHRQKGDRDANLEQAIAYAKQTLEIYHPDTHPRQWTLVQLTLGNMYCDRVSGLRACNDLRAVRCFRNVLKRCNRESDPLRWAEAMNNLGTVYASRSTHPSDANYRKAIDCFRQALEVRTPDTMPAKALQTATNWGNLDFWFSRWARASESFQTALKAGKALYQASSTEAGRRAELAETWQLVAQAAYCWLRMGQPDQALLELEGGKAQMLAEALALGDSDLSELPDSQRKAILRARQIIRKLEAEMRLPQDAPGRQDDRVLAGKLQKARAELDQLVQTIRAEYPDFMPTGLNLRGILAQIPEGGALVAPLVTARGSAAFVLPSGTEKVRKKHVVYLDAFTAADLNLLLIGNQWNPGWLHAYAAWREAENGSLQGWQAAIETFTSHLWEALMGPIHQRLSDLGLSESAPVTLMPQGGLGLLPLHAAWRRVNGMQRAFLDDYTVSYAPSAYALSVSRRRLGDEHRHKSALLAVINPTGDLRHAPIEGRTVADMFPPEARQVLLETEATQEAVLRKAPGHTYLHFACHGSYGWQDVMRTALVLADHNTFTLSEILSKLALDVARLVTLSACETGLTEFQTSPDEYIGLPAGFLQAGAPGVVSSLWMVDDRSTALLMERFYHNHLKGGAPIPHALREAQLWLRDVTRKELGEYYLSLVSTGAADALDVYTEITLGGDPDDKPYADTFYWGAFTYTGM